jgi:viologen exporter family transport system permease protein
VRGLRGLGKYLAIARLAARQRLEERAVLWGRVLFYFIILLVFSRLWHALLGAHSASAPPGGVGGGQRPSHYIWYLAVTEWIMLSQPLLHLEIEADIRAGALGQALSRPVSYVAGKLAEAWGEVGVRLVVLGASGLCFARWLGAEWPEPSALALAALAGLVASVVMTLALAAIGLCAVWVTDSTSLYLIWQKLCFVLGGLMLPLSIYPPWLRSVAEWSPFAALLFGPAELVLGAPPQRLLVCLIQLVGWGGLFGLTLAALERRVSRIITVRGG